MKKGLSGNWLITALGVFLGLLVIWVVAVVTIRPAGAGLFNLGFDLRSRLTADYGVDAPHRQVGVLRFSIVSDIMRELGMPPQDAESYEQGVEVSMLDPVPTATARDFEGSAPFTATSTVTPTLTETPTATPIPTNTPRPTRTPTRTPAPTNVPATGGPTSGPSDTQNPQVCCLDLLPDPPATLDTCTVVVEDLHVFDPAFSAGILTSDVYIKYQNVTRGSGWISNGLNLMSGGFVSGPGSAFDAHYNGSITVSGSAGDVLEFKAKVTDKAGRTAYSSVLTLTLSVTCP